MSKIYVAAQFDHHQDVKTAYKRILAAGHDITADWTDHQAMPAPITDIKLAKEYAINDSEGAKSADVFVILLFGQQSIGAHIEFGIALGLGKPIYVVSDGSVDHLFYHHPLVKPVKTVDEFLENLDR